MMVHITIKKSEEALNSIKSKVQSNRKKDAAIWLKREKKKNGMGVLEYILNIHG